MKSGGGLGTEFREDPPVELKPELVSTVKTHRDMVPSVPALPLQCPPPPSFTRVLGQASKAKVEQLA